MQDQDLSPARKKKSKGLIIGVLIIFLIGIVAYFNFEIIYTVYHYTFKVDSFKTGDKMYANDHVAINLCRLIRPLTKDDIDTMQVSDTEKLRLQLNLDDSLKPYMINSGDYISTAGNSNYIGTYIQHEFATFAYQVKKRVYDNVFVIKPNNSMLEHSDYGAEAMPKGYTWANNAYYVWCDLVSNNETFKIKK